MDNEMCINKVCVVIGANYGDEGKGLFTDFLCNKELKDNNKPLVVLANGGAQRGHTVVTPDGIEHVFHHFGSGTLLGVPTYFSKEYVLNPMIFAKEYQELESLGCNIKLYAESGCKISTPFDMILNQIQMKADGLNNSCGCGIWETIHRYEKFNSRNKECHTVDFYSVLSYDGILEAVNDSKAYMLEEISDRGLSIDDGWKDILHNDNLIDHYIKDLQFMLSKIEITKMHNIHLYDTLIFEMGQGLGLSQSVLDQDNYITSSFTGLDGLAPILSRLLPPNLREDISLNVYYISRCYNTRHGDGEIECGNSFIYSKHLTEFLHKCEKTNVYNEFQGKFKIGALPVYYLHNRITDDIIHFLNDSKDTYPNSKDDYIKYSKKYGYSNDKITKQIYDNIYIELDNNDWLDLHINVVITHMDELEEYYNNDIITLGLSRSETNKVSLLINYIKKYMFEKYVSYGRTRDDIIFFKEVLDDNRSN